jgi:hypothetical protein
MFSQTRPILPDTIHPPVQPHFQHPQQHRSIDQNLESIEPTFPHRPKKNPSSLNSTPLKKQRKFTTLILPARDLAPVSERNPQQTPFAAMHRWQGCETRGSVPFCSFGRIYLLKDLWKIWDGDGEDLRFQARVGIVFRFGRHLITSVVAITQGGMQFVDYTGHDHQHDF